MTNVDVVVIGGGSGGYTAALRLTQRGKSVCLVEKERLGGICLLHGCIPSKALLHAAELKHSLANSENIGLEGNVSLDIIKLQEWKTQIIEKLVAQVEGQCKKAGIEVVQGNARLSSKNVVQVNGEEITAGNIIIATGSRPMGIPGFGFDGHNVLSSREMLALTEVPATLHIIGAGVIGLEMATFYAKLGSEVTIVEMLDSILPFADKDVSRVIIKNLGEMGITLKTSSKAKSCEVNEDEVQVCVEQNGEENVMTFEKVLVAVGRRPNSDGLGLEEQGIELDGKGFVKVNDEMQTSISGIYAIGDVVGEPMLAHKASQQGLIASENIAGTGRKYSTLMPITVHTDPEIGVVGLSEKEALEKGLEIISKRYYFAALGKALAINNTKGFIKLIADKNSGKLLGAQIVGPDASNLIGELVIALEKGMTVEELATIVHAHPTLSEAIGEAARCMLE